MAKQRLYLCLLRIALPITIFLFFVVFLPFPYFLPATLRNSLIPHRPRFLIHSMSGFGSDLESNPTTNGGKLSFGTSCCDFSLQEYLPLTLQVLEAGETLSLPLFGHSYLTILRMKMALGHTVLHDSCFFCAYLRDGTSLL